MSRTIDLPGGYQAVLRDKVTTERQRRPLEIAALAAGAAFEHLEKATAGTAALSWEEAEAVARLQDAAIVAYLESWTRPEPLPTLETVGDLDTDTFDALGVGVMPLMAQLAPRTDFSPQPAGANPTGASSSSNEPSRDEVAPIPTPESEPSTESTSIAPSTPG